MLLTKEVEDVQSSGLGRGNTFSIAASPKAFEILSSNLYQNKILAVIREISCNAADAHSMVGKPLSEIQVHLPTFAEPWFAVRDFGPGLSTEDVLELYTTYFRSTKDNDNSMIGGFGLGSKSPFAVADQFTVTSWHGGTKSHFVCYKDGGLPQVNMTGSSPSSEPNGLLVQVAVRGFDTWRLEAQNFYQWWPELPKLNTGTITHLLNKDNIIASSKNLDSRGIPEWALVRSYSRPQVFMGLVPYALNVSAIPDIDQSLRNVFDSLPLFLRFDVGQLSISPSREALSYDKSTAGILIAKLKAIADEVTAGVKNELDNCKSLFEARRYVYEEMAKLAGFGQTLVRLADAGRLKWNGIVVSSKVNLDLTKDFASAVQVQTYGRRSYSKTWRRGWQENYNYYNNINRYANRSFYVWAPALTAKSYRTIANYLDDYAAQPGQADPIYEAVIFVGSTFADVEKILRDKGLPPIINIGTLPEPPKVQRKSKTSPKTKGYTINSDFTYNRNESDIDLTDGGIYFEFKFGEPTEPGAFQVARTLSYLKLLPQPLNIYGFREASLKTKTLQTNLANNGWSPFDPTWFADNIAGSDLYRVAYESHLVDFLSNHTYLRKLVEDPKPTWTRTPDEAVRQHLLTILKYSVSGHAGLGKACDPFAAHYSKAQKDLVNKAVADANVVTDLLTQFEGRHPLLPYLFIHYSLQPKHDDVLDYINR